MPRTKPFDEQYERYEEWFEKNRFAYHSELMALRHFVPAQGHGIEIGIGSGRFAQPLGIELGVEPSKSMRKLARKRGLRVYDAVAERLPFEGEKFDFVLMVTTICFLDDIRTSFKEVRRVLKKGGCFIIGFVDRGSPLGKSYEKHRDNNIFYREATFYETGEVLSLLQEFGFEDPKEIQTIFGDLSEVKEVQEFTEGYGQGGFVVIRVENR